MARRKPVEAPYSEETAVEEYNPHLVVNDVPGSRLWLADGTVLEYGESGECAETAQVLRERGNG